MANSQDWHKFYEQRYQWATDAYQSFLDRVDPDLQADLKRTDQVTIVVYGSTQVGKTSLILKLLRIKESCMSEVSKPLRGGREMGKSSTIMPIRYRKSVDDQWHFRDSQGTNIDVSTVDEYFRKLRETVEYGRQHQREVIDVHIPQKYFISDLEQTPLDVRILDLPGIQAIDTNEQSHVEKIAKQYATTADVILLVGRLDDLSFLNPERLVLDEFKYWTSQLNRFRVVFTYAFSPITVLDYIAKNKEHFDFNSFKGRIFEQLITHDFIKSSECKDIIYPLEFGRSLMNMEKQNFSNIDNINKVNNDSFEALYNSLRKAANPYARFMNGFNVQRLIENKIKVEADGYKESESNLNEELKCFNLDLNDIENILNDFYDKKIKTNNEIKKLSDLNKRNFVEDICKIFSNFLNLKKPNVKKVSALKSWLREVSAEMRKCWGRLDTIEILEYDDFYFGQPPSLDTTNIATCYKILNNHSFDKYLFDSNFDKDYYFLYDAIDKEVSNFSNEAANKIRFYCERKNNVMTQELIRIEREIEILKYSKEQKSNLKNQVENNLKDLNHKYGIFKDDMKEAIRHAESFKDLMRLSFEETCKQSKMNFINEKNAIIKFHRLWYSILLEQQYTKFSEVEK
ncbi:dynamin family protein [Acinetobacter sp. ANC 4178]|uniref:dynamin family protein n=1 Tax=Acinetobacter sp. ANC 4178 TaxID=2529839 RepID=UPI001038B487|nr:dynamin family protein [Acinetobacter sp. ANC 4178]TCB67507.1 hypothetical protein E0H87_04735 [Acinetobacter sp. ANC 4178]